jgi:hypothetical protein
MERRKMLLERFFARGGEHPGQRAKWRDGGRRVNGTVLIAVLPVG